MTSTMPTQVAAGSGKILIHVEGRIIDATEKKVIFEGERMRRMPDGSFIFPARGTPPEVPHGYARDPGDPYHIIPVLPCPHQRQEIRRLSCGKLKPVIYCTYLNSIVTEDICMTCDKCPL